MKKEELDRRCIPSMLVSLHQINDWELFIFCIGAKAPHNPALYNMYYHPEYHPQLLPCCFDLYQSNRTPIPETQVPEGIGVIGSLPGVGSG